MTDEVLSKLISAQLDQAFIDNQDTISDELAACARPGEQVIPATVRMVLKSMRLSAQMSVQLTLRILEEAKILSLPPDGTPLLYPLDKE